VVFPGTIIFLYLLFMGQLREILRMHPIRGILLYFMIASPWYYAMYTVHSMDFINTFLGFHNITRFTTPEHASRVTFWYYFPVIILGMFPWTGILLQSIKSSLSDSRIDEMRTLMFMHVWWVFVLLFFTICKTKLVSYILPMFPALAILIGWNISRMIAKLRYNTTFYSWIVGSGIMFSLLGVAWVIGGQQLPELEFSGLVLGGLTFVLGFAALFTLWYYRDIEMASWLHVATGATIMVVAFAFVLPIIEDRFSVKNISQVYRQECKQETEIYVDKFLRPGFMYYAGKPGVEMLPKTDAFAKALRKEEHKYFLVRGLEYRRLLKLQAKPDNLHTVSEIGDIYLLEQK
ncbi:MAG: glycosyltransferase family 39 protein, partial [Phascolarctobacterium sp.]|nr:glycosyltransferase family 39 protein [Phascolarctobacterium sp.]